MSTPWPLFIPCLVSSDLSNYCTNSTARIRTFYFVNRIWKMVSARLGKEIEKNVFLFNITSVGQRKNCEFPWGIEPWTLEFCFLMLYHWATETSWWARPLQNSQKICVLLITRISNVNGIMFCKQNKKIAVCHVWTSYWAFLTSESS